MNTIAGTAPTAASTVLRAPGPKGLPFFGSAFNAWRDPIGFMMESREIYGDVVKFKFGPFDYYMVTDPDVVHHVLIENAKAYKKSRNYLGLKIVLGDGLLTSEGEQWKRQRKLSQPAFHRARLANFANQMSTATRAMLDRWQGSKPIDEAFCVHEEMMRLTFRIVGLTLFSADVDGDAKPVGQALDTALRWANDYAESMIRIPPYIPTPNNVRFNRAMKTLDSIVYRLIADRRAAPTCGDDLLGMLMESVGEDGERMTDRQLRDEVITMVLAGHETTANLLSWTFSLLAKHPEVEAKIREEALRVLGKARDPALEDTKQLEYTKRVLEEGLRMYPPAWIFERQTTEPDVLGKYTVKTGSIIGVASYILHRHPAYWEEPDKFNPDRFLPENAEKRPRYSYLPFGGGNRMCIGNHFAMMEAQIILAMIVRDERLRLDPNHPITMDPLITLRPKHGIRVMRTNAD